MVDEADLQYLRNINTKPGPDAGRSIDPTKPGPDDVIAYPGIQPDPMQVICPNCAHQFKAISVADQAALAQSDAEPETYGDQLRRIMKRQAMQSDAKPIKQLLRKARAYVIPACCDEESYETVKNRQALIAAIDTTLEQSDPAKPGPDDVLPREHQDPSKFPTRETVEQAHNLTQSVFHEAHGRRSILTAIRKSIELVENEIIDEEQCFMLRTAMRKIEALLQSDTKRIAELEAECGRFENELFEARAALAQSDAKPGPDDRWPSTMDKLVEKMARAICKADGDPKDNWTEWVPHAQAALAQSDDRASSGPGSTYPRHGEWWNSKQWGGPNAQSDAEPVAWQIRTKLTQGNWTFWLGDGKPDLNDKVYEVRPLFLAPPRPND